MIKKRYVQPTVWMAILFCIAAAGFLEYKRWEYCLARKIRTTPADRRADAISRHYDFILPRVRVGMSKRQVERVVGLPQNMDRQHVWAWAFEPGEGMSLTNERWADRLIRCDLMYIVFLDEKVTGNPLGVRASAAESPVELVMSIKDCDERAAMILLGMSEEEIENHFRWQDALKKSWEEFEARKSASQ